MTASAAGIAPPGLARFPAIDTHSPSEARAYIARNYSGLEFFESRVPLRDFHFAANMLALDDFRVSAGVTTPLLVGGTMQNLARLSILVQGRMEVSEPGIGQIELRSGDAFFAGEQPTFNYAATTQSFGVAFELNRLRQRLVDWTGGRRLDIGPKHLVLSDRTQPHAELVRVMRAVFNFIDGLGPIAPSRIGLIGIDEMVMRAVALSYVPGFAEAMEQSVPKAGARHVRRAKDYIDAHVLEPVRVSDIARHLGLSVRALQLAFRNELGTSPKIYLRQRRLDAARDRLARGAAGDNVTRVATDCGFLHLGEFAHAFRRRFGVTPSTILREAQRR